MILSFCAILYNNTVKYHCNKICEVGQYTFYVTFNINIYLTYTHKTKVFKCFHYEKAVQILQHRTSEFNIKVIKIEVLAENKIYGYPKEDETKGSNW